MLSLAHSFSEHFQHVQASGSHLDAMRLYSENMSIVHGMVSMNIECLGWPCDYIPGACEVI